MAQIVEAGRGIGLDLMLIDTPPNATDEVEAAIAVADTIVIPTGVALFDLKAVTRTVRVATQANKPFSVVLNRIGNRSDREAARIRRELNKVGMPILGDVVPRSEGVQKLVGPTAPQPPSSTKPKGRAPTIFGLCGS